MDIEEFIEAIALGRDLDEHDERRLHPVEAADRLKEDLVGRKALRAAVVLEG